MPPARWYFRVVRAFIAAAGGFVLGELATIGLHRLTWLAAGITGAIAAGNEGHVAWPDDPPRRRTRRRRPEEPTL